MKKVIIALAFVTSLVVTSCGSSDSAEAVKGLDSTVTAPTSTVTIVDTVKATNDTIK